MLLQCEKKTNVSNRSQDRFVSELESIELFNNKHEVTMKASKYDVNSRSNSFPAQAGDSNSNEKSEYTEHFAQRLLIEFGKTRTNYNSLVPRIVEVIRLYRDYGPLHCPLPVVSNLEGLLNDEALSSIEQRYPNSLDAGFVVLCSERRALRSGGGGKYYFIDVSGRLIGCHKSDLPNYAEKKVLNGPVLLKNLIFVFIMRNAYGLDPRCKSSNPQRLLEYYENLAKEGKTMEIQRLVRVWSMEIFPESPFDAGYPHCSLLWVKKMHLGAHITKWKRSSWNSAQLRSQDLYSQQNQLLNNSYSQFYNTDPPENMQYYTDTYQQNNSKTTKRRRTSKTSASPMPQYDLAWGNPYYHDPLSKSYSESQQWDSYHVYQLYATFNQYAPHFQKSDVRDWCHSCTERLSTQILAAATQLIASTFQITFNEPYDENDHSSLQKLILKTINSFEEREKYIEALRILLACLVQQQRLESVMPKTELIRNELYSKNIQNAMTPISSNLNYRKSTEWKNELETVSTADTASIKSNGKTPLPYHQSGQSQYSYQTVTSPPGAYNELSHGKNVKIETSSKINDIKLQNNNNSKYYLDPETAWKYNDPSSDPASSNYPNKKRSLECNKDSFYSTPICYAKDFYNIIIQSNLENSEKSNVTVNSNYTDTSESTYNKRNEPISSDMLNKIQNISSENLMNEKSNWHTKNDQFKPPSINDSLQYQFEECLSFISEISDSTYNKSTV